MKKILQLLLFISSFSGFSQGALSLTVGSSKDKVEDRGPFGNLDIYSGKGFNIILNYEHQFSKRFGFDGGVEYSKTKVFKEGVTVGTASFFPISDYDRRFGAKFGFFYKPIQRNKWSWKLSTLSNFYFDLEGEGIGKFGRNQLDEFNYGATIMNTFKFKVAENVSIMTTQSYDLYYNFSGAFDRWNFNFGVAYDFN